jgi:DNA sulfur modification protein DndE
MFFSIKTSEENKDRVSDLTNKLQLGTENVIARLALSYSLAKKDKLELKDIKDSKGKGYREKVLFGDNLPFYISLISQRYGLYKTNQEIPRYLKLHIDDGIEMIYTEVTDNPNQIGTEFLLEIIEEGIIAAI